MRVIAFSSVLSTQGVKPLPNIVPKINKSVVQVSACLSRIKGRGQTRPHIGRAPPPKPSPPAAVRRSPQYHCAPVASAARVFGKGKRMKTRKMYTAITTASALAFSLLGAFYFFKPFHAVSESTSTTAKPVPASKAEMEAAYGKLPLSFEANRGQTDGQVKFLSRGHGYGLYLTATETVLKLRNESSILRMKLLGANPRPKVAGVDQLPGKTNYFIGNDPKKWRKDIPTYAKVKYEAVYPGVDVVYYGAQGRELEYDFIVAPGADPKAIKLSFEGADKLELNEQGDLVLRLSGKPIHLRKPVVYQEKDGGRQEIAGKYALAGASDVGIDIAAYDASRPLVIDPVLAYSTYLGGTGLDMGLDIAVNAHGSAF